MTKPKLTDYANLIFTLSDKFEQQEMQDECKKGRPFTYSQKCFTLLFIIMQLRRIFTFKAQRR